MSGKITTRLALFAAVAALAAVVVPATFALGSHESGGTTEGAPSYVFLEMGRNDRVTFQGQTQSITTRNNDCTVVTLGNPKLLELTAFGGVLGHTKDALGVQSPGDGSGEPCSRVDSGKSEAISVGLGSAMASYVMTAIDVDLELKGNAIVAVSYLHDGVPVASHTFDPTAASDDGPDSGDGDNYRYAHRPLNAGEPVYFDEVKFTPASGILSLEGGSDGTENGSLANNNFSQFEVIRGFDGEITCGDEEPIGAGGTTSGVVTMHSEDKGAGWLLDPNCDLKPYNAWTTDDSLAFVPELEGTTARYTIAVTVKDQEIVVEPDGTISSLIAVYDPAPALAFPDVSADLPLPACLDTPVLVEGAAYNAFWTQADVGLLPENASACWYEASVAPTGDGVGTETWGIYFEDDPGFGFK
ncbi:MAG TPA: hypothetical protein VFS66_02200 [Acidimicrobiia bacterium]|nr:hypothetical protein [Acidimicrobiia bacterium]